MISRSGPQPIARFLPVGPEAIESYEEWQERIGRRSEARRRFISAAVEWLARQRLGGGIARLRAAEAGPSEASRIVS